MQADTYLVEFRWRAHKGGLTNWTTVEREAPATMAEVVALIADYHEAYTDNYNRTDAQGGLFRAHVLQADTGRFRDVTEEALEAFGRWHLEARDAWPWFIDMPRDVAKAVA